VSLIGAKPVFVDINENNFNIDISKIKTAITVKTKAIIPVHLYGQPVDMDHLIEIANENNIKIIEDACQAHGAEYKGKKVGIFSDSGCFSFYPAKNLGAFGDGGAIVTNNEEVAEKVKLLRNYGQKVKYYHLMKGPNTRLDSIQAAILDVKLRHLEKWNKLRRENAKFYYSLLNEMKIKSPIEEKFAKHVYHLFVIRTEKRDELQKFLKKRGVSTGIHYPIPIHLQKAYSEFGNTEGSMPIAEKVSKEILSLPMYPELGKEQIGYVVDSIKSFYKNE
ncbi:MAG: DegT/DnrJ/EryC1/StrS family aminotransferase, partial [Candidatus Thorarchaeota archaeon]